MLKSFFKNVSSGLLAVIVVPTTELKDWKSEQFTRAEKNQVTVSAQGLKIQVNKSASPLIYSLGKKTKLTGFKIRGEFLGLPKFDDVLKQGQKGFDDYPLRVGFIVAGDKKLSGIKKMFAAKWVTRLYEQVPEGMGLDSVHFYNVTQNVKQVGTSRFHPASNLLKENFFASVTTSGPFNYDYQFEKPMDDVVALWMSIDGDDTKSEFAVIVSALELK